MRAVAVLVILLAIPAVMPTAPATPNDCTVNAAAARACAAVPVPNPVGGSYYVYAGDMSCVSGPSSNACRGQSSIVYGSVYAETNGLSGLQREPVVWNGKSYPADRPLVL